MALRLADVVPAGFTVDAVDGDVVVRGPSTDLGSSGAAAILDDPDGRSWPEKVETAARAVLSGVQDLISVEVAENWPVAHRAGGNLPGARITSDGVRLWFGPDDAPVLLLAPVPLT